MEGVLPSIGKAISLRPTVSLFTAFLNIVTSHYR